MKKSKGLEKIRTKTYGYDGRLIILDRETGSMELGLFPDICTAFLALQGLGIRDERLQKKLKKP